VVINWSLRDMSLPDGMLVLPGLGGVTTEPVASDAEKVLVLDVAMDVGIDVAVGIDDEDPFESLSDCWHY
jgi:hypothetical protein